MKTEKIHCNSTGVNIDRWTPFPLKPPGKLPANVTLCKYGYLL